MKEGSKYALFQSSGTLSVLHEFSKMISSGSVMTSANSLRTLGCQPLGPVDLNISGLFKFSFTHSSPSPSWISAPFFKSYLSLSGYHMDFWKLTLRLCCLSINFLFEANKKKMYFILLKSLFVFWKRFTSLSFNVSYENRKVKKLNKIHLVIVCLPKSHHSILYFGSLSHRISVNLGQNISNAT